MADSAPIAEQSIFIKGPDFHIDLAPLDARHPLYYSRRLLIFRCASAAQRSAQLSALKSGLQALVAKCPILAGTVDALPLPEAREKQDDWRTIVPGNGLELVVRDLRRKLVSFEELEANEFPVTELPQDLLMPVDANLKIDEPYAACKVQFSAIEGGSIITWSMSHSVSDGAGNNELLSVLSREVRRARDGSSSSFSAEVVESAKNPEVIGMDRSVLRNITSDTPFQIKDHPAYQYKSLRPKALEPPASLPPRHPYISDADEVPVLLRISPAGLAKLKADATTPDAPPISTHDAITGLIWRSVLLLRSRRSAAARALPASTTGSIFMPTDGRKHLALPPSYIGNAVYQLSASLAIGTLFSPTGLQHAARAIRGALAAITPQGAASVMAELKTDWLDWWRFMGVYNSTGVCMGTDWTSAATYADDWGPAFGPLARFRFPGAPMNCVLPKLPGGSAELVVCVLPAEVDALKGEECFGKYTAVEWT